MFCPKCSRPVGDEVQFCQQCGLALEGVRKLLAGGGGADPSAAASDAPAVVPKPRGLSKRLRGYRQGFKLLLLALLVLPFYPAAEHFFDWLIPGVENSRLDELPMEIFGAALFVVFLGGLLRVLYARLFESAEAPAAPAGEGETRPSMFSSFKSRALPRAHSVPAEDFAPRRVNTADLAKPRSVTEHTTRSLRAD